MSGNLNDSNANSFGFIDIMMKGIRHRFDIFLLSNHFEVTTY